MANDTTTNIIQYGSRTFGDIRTDLISYIRQAYPEVLSDFTDSSVGSMMIDLNAGVTNNLSINTDRAFQETQHGKELFKRRHTAYQADKPAYREREPLREGKTHNAVHCRGVERD